MKKAFVCIGVFAGAHGVRGDVHIRFFTEQPWSVQQFPEVWDETGTQAYHLSQVRGLKKDMFIGSFKEILSREQAQSLKGKRLYIARESLPILKEEETYYQTDLMGCEVYTLEGALFGVVQKIHNFGAGDILEIGGAGEKNSVMVSFSKRAVPEVDLKNRRLILNTAFALDSLKEKK